MSCELPIRFGLSAAPAAASLHSTSRTPCRPPKLRTKLKLELYHHLVARMPMLHGQSRDITRALVRDLVPEFVVTGEFLVKKGSTGKKLIFIHQCAAALHERVPRARVGACGPSQSHPTPRPTLWPQRPRGRAWSGQRVAPAVPRPRRLCWRDRADTGLPARRLGGRRFLLRFAACAAHVCRPWVMAVAQIVDRRCVRRGRIL